MTATEGQDATPLDRREAIGNGAEATTCIVLIGAITLLLAAIVTYAWGAYLDVLWYALAVSTVIAGLIADKWASQH